MPTISLSALSALIPRGRNRQRLAVALLAVGATYLVVRLYRSVRRRKKDRVDGNGNSYHFVSPHWDSNPSSSFQRIRNGSVRISECASEDRLQLSLSPAQDVLMYMGVQNLTDAVKYWEQASKVSVLKGGSSNESLARAIDRILQSAERLQRDLSKLIDEQGWKRCALTKRGGGGDMRSSGSLLSYSGRRGPGGGRHAMSILSDDSWASALDELIPTFPDIDVLARPPLSFELHELLAYHAGLREVQAGNVVCRVLRTEAFQCSADDEFLAKLHCVRHVMGVVLSDASKRTWLMSHGKQLMSDLLQVANKDPTPFCTAFDRLIDLSLDTGRFKDYEEEVRSQKIAGFNFYDVVLDYMLMDAFDDLAHPPASILAVAQNRFLSNSFKESTLSTLVWSVLKTKRSRLSSSDGFLSHFYDVSENISPTLVWGFLGTDENLRDLCYFFKDQIVAFLLDLFNFERVRYTNFEDLVEDSWLIVQRRVQLVHDRVQMAV